MTDLPQTTNFRTLVYQISPTALQGPVGAKLMYDLAVQYDGLAAAGAYAVRFRFPTYAPVDALPWLAQDRQIDRGPNESQTSYTSRLIQWLDLWVHAGSADSIITALDAFVLPSTITIEHVKDTRHYGLGTSWNDWDVSNASTAPYTQRVSPANWNWDNNGAVMGPADQRFITVTKAGLQTPYWRTWVVIYAGALWTQGPAWGAAGAQWGVDGHTWGFSAGEDTVAGIRQQVAKWKGAESLVQWIVVSFDATWFVNTNAPNTKMPDGTWARWGKVTSTTFGTTTVNVYTAARSSTASYLDGTA